MYDIKVAELPCKLQCLFSRFLVQSFENFKYLPKYFKSANLFSLVQSNSLQQLTSKDTGAGTQKLTRYIIIWGSGFGGHNIYRYKFSYRFHFTDIQSC